MDLTSRRRGLTQRRFEQRALWNALSTVYATAKGVVGSATGLWFYIDAVYLHRGRTKEAQALRLFYILYLDFFDFSVDPEVGDDLSSKLDCGAMIRTPFEVEDLDTDHLLSLLAEQWLRLRDSLAARRLHYSACAERTAVPP